MFEIFDVNLDIGMKQNTSIEGQLLRHHTVSSICTYARRVTVFPAPYYSAETAMEKLQIM